MKEQIAQIAREMRTEYARILGYWTDNMQDPAGGFYGERDKHNRLLPDAPKGAILNARILWTFAAAGRVTGNPDYRRMAERAYNYIVDHFYDTANGGFYWSVDAQGRPLDTKKQAYAEGFCIYGLSEYYRMCGDRASLDLAIDTFRLIEKHFRDPKDGGYIEALAADWTPMADVRLSDKDENTPKSMNTHLHILEPYTNLFRAWPSDELRSAVEHCIGIFFDRIIDPATGHFNLFFDMEWRVMSRIDSYGHDIEGAWLLYEAIEAIGRRDLADKYRPACKRLVDVTIAEGFDGRSSVFYEKVDGHLDTDKHWWPQAEAMVGLADTWRLTGDDRYLELMAEVWRYVRAHLCDMQGGEWLWRVDRDGRDAYDDCKAGFWKCPYHNSRAILEVLHRIEHQH